MPDANSGAPSAEAQAREMGWRPREEFKGDASKWVDAETFVRRGEEVMPLLKAQNGKLKGEIDSLKGTISQLQTTVQAGQEALTELQKYHQETAQRAYEKALKDLKAERRAALSEGDHVRADEIEEQIEELKPPPKPAEAPAVKPAAPVSPDLVAWEQDNAMWLAEPEKKAYAQAMANYLRATGSRLEGRAFLDEVTKLVEKQFGGASRRGTQTEGGGDPLPPSGGRSRTFANLPAEARAACDRMGARLVGAGRAFKTIDDWRAQYVRDYQWE